MSVLKARDFGRAVALMFTSSTMSRYLASAIDVAESSGLRSQIQSDPSSVTSLLRQAAAAWRTVLGSKTRGESEVDVAVLMASLRDVPRPDVSRFFRTVGLCNHEAALWLAAMARRVLENRTENNTIVDYSIAVQKGIHWSVGQHFQPLEMDLRERRFSVAGAA